MLQNDLFREEPWMRNAVRIFAERSSALWSSSFRSDCGFDISSNDMVLRRAELVSANLESRGSDVSLSHHRSMIGFG
jgi:hypothetical protein